MSIAYIRMAYGVNFHVGDAVRIRHGAGTRFDGMSGKLLRAKDQYLIVAGETWEAKFHPDDVEQVASKTQE